MKRLKRLVFTHRCSVIFFRMRNSGNEKDSWEMGSLYFVGPRENRGRERKSSQRKRRRRKKKDFARAINFQTAGAAAATAYIDPFICSNETAANSCAYLCFVKVTWKGFIVPGLERLFIRLFAQSWRDEGSSKRHDMKRILKSDFFGALIDKSLGSAILKNCFSDMTNQLDSILPKIFF